MKETKTISGQAGRKTLMKKNGSIIYPFIRKMTTKLINGVHETYLKPINVFPKG